MSAVTGAVPAATQQRGSVALLRHQIRYEQLSFWRNPQSAFFTFAFPVLIVVIFRAMFNGVEPSSDYDGLTPLQYYIPTIAAVSVLGACYSQLAIGLAIRRQTGILKRLRATPLPAWTPARGREQRRSRPAVVVSSGGYLDSVRGLVIVVPVTSVDRGWPHHVAIEGDTWRLRKRSFAMTEEPRTITLERIVRTAGTVGAATMAQVDGWLRDFIGL
jgi:mRNA-degrading endonuclease toxin of MazEF toxin-antitoxin module